MNHVVDAYVGIGSNLGDRRATIEAGVSDLLTTPGVGRAVMSQLIETHPIGPITQPMFLNGAVMVSTSMSPRELLNALLAIERRHGRDRNQSSRGGPRPLDLDLLLFGDRIISEPGLTVPHPRLADRLFVLIPLAEIAPDRVHPILHRAISELLTDARNQIDRAAPG